MIYTNCFFAGLWHRAVPSAVLRVYLSAQLPSLPNNTDDKYIRSGLVRLRRPKNDLRIMASVEFSVWTMKDDQRLRYSAPSFEPKGESRIAATTLYSQKSSPIYSCRLAASLSRAMLGTAATRVLGRGAYDLQTHASCQEATAQSFKPQRPLLW